MTRLVTTCVLALGLSLGLAAPASAGPGVSPGGRTLGVGFQVGAPTAITLKTMGGPGFGVQGGIGGGAPWLLGPTLSLHLDGVWHPVMLLDDPDFGLSPYFGIGGQVGLAPFELVPNPYFSKKHTVFGYPYYPYTNLGLSAAVRAPIGLSFVLHQVPLEFYGSLVPSLLFFPAIGGGLGGNLGMRFWF